MRVAAFLLLATICCRAQSIPLPLAVQPLRTNTGAWLIMAWDQSIDPTVIGYRRFMGTSSGVYTNVLDVGSATTNLTKGLVRGRSYFFAVTAYDDFGLESLFSNEIEYDVPPPKTNSVVRVTGAHDISGDLLAWRTLFEDPWVRTNDPGPWYFRNPFQPPAITNWHY